MAIVDKPWVPIRTDLEHDPRVIAIARTVDRALANVPREYRRDIVCWRLRCVWSYWVTHSVAGHIVGFTAEDVDHVASIDGFGKAMAQERAGENPWMVFDASGAHIPDFDRWHWITLRQRATDAEKQKRYRDRKKTKQADGDGEDVTGGVTVTSLGALRSRHAADGNEKVTPIKTETDTETKKEFPPSPHGGAGEIRAGPSGAGGGNPSWDVQRLLRDAGCDADVAERLSRRPRLTPDVASGLAADCAAARPSNPTGWLITRLREVGIEPKGKPK